jgi:hypothetical protein
MPWGLKVIRKFEYASNFPLIRALCQNLITRTQSQMPTSGHFVTMGFQPRVAKKLRARGQCPRGRFIIGVVSEEGLVVNRR